VGICTLGEPGCRLQFFLLEVLADQPTPSASSAALKHEPAYCNNANKRMVLGEQMLLLATLPGSNICCCQPGNHADACTRAVCITRQPSQSLSYTRLYMLLEFEQTCLAGRCLRKRAAHGMGLHYRQLLRQTQLWECMLHCKASTKAV
jgi:hypothetical protein